jgi:hypothetical protein
VQDSAGEHGQSMIAQALQDSVRSTGSAGERTQHRTVPETAVSAGQCRRAQSVKGSAGESK